MFCIEGLNPELVAQIGTNTLPLVHRVAYTDKAVLQPRKVEDLLSQVSYDLSRLEEAREGGTSAFWYMPQLQILAAALAIHPNIGPEHVSVIDNNHACWRGTFVWTKEHEMQMLVHHARALKEKPKLMRETIETLLQPDSVIIAGNLDISTHVNIYLSTLCEMFKDLHSGLQRDNPLGNIVLPVYQYVEKKHVMYGVVLDQIIHWHKGTQTTDLWDRVQKAFEILERTLESADVVPLKPKS